MTFSPLPPPAPTRVDDDRRSRWIADGFVHLPGVLEERERRHLPECVDEISRSDDPRLLHHHEQTDDGPVLARTEYFADVHAGLGALVRSGAVAESGAELLGEPVVLYKEKINFKLAGGAGSTAHQDATAYPFIDAHLTCMIAVDPSTESNGCLEFAAGHHRDLFDDDGDGCLPTAVEQSLEWRPLEMAPGAAVWFHSRTPHRSADNRSDTPRRAIFLTFNASSEGDRREDYYAAKRARLAGHTADTRTRVSTIGHFRGRAVDPTPTGGS